MKTRVIMLFLITSMILSIGVQAETATQKNQVKDESKQIVATINDMPVYMSELDKKVEGLLDKFREINPDIKISDERRASMRKSFLDRLIREKILAMAVKDADITVSDKEIDERIEQLQQLFGKDEKAKEAFLGGIKDMDRFRKDIKEQIKIDHWMDQQIEKTIEVTSDEVREYYDKNLEKFSQAAQAHARHVLWKLPPQETDDFDKEKENALKEAQTIVEAVSSGSDFTELAQKFSQDSLTKDKGGDLGWISKGQKVPKMDEIIFSLHVGEVSKPFETAMGLHIVQLIEKKEAQTKQFDEVKDVIEQRLKSMQKREKRENIYSELHEKADIKILLK